MDLPVYLRVLWLYRWLLAGGVVVALAAGVAAGYTLEDGAIRSRTEKTFTATASLLVTSPSNSLYLTKVPRPTAGSDEMATGSGALTEATLVYAYLVSGSVFREAVEAKMGPLAAAESISARRRTAPATGDDRFPRALPVLDIKGTSFSPVRAEQISVTANAAFRAHLTAQQDSQKIDEESRVQLVTLTEDAAVASANSSPLIPVVITFTGVFVSFLALALTLHNFGLSVGRAERRRRPGGSARGGAGNSPDDLRDGSAVTSQAPTCPI